MSFPTNTEQPADAEESANRSTFPVTLWSRLVALREGDEDGRREILNFLFRRYWKPVYLFVRRKGYDDDRAKDLVQAFFTKAFASDLFTKAQKSRGRFRNLLLKSLQHFLLNARRHGEAKVRNPSAGFVTIHEVSTEEGPAVVPKDTETPEEIFQRTWLRELVRRVLSALAAECRETGKTVHFELLRLRILAPVLDGAEPLSATELAEKFGLSVEDVRNRIVTARRAFQRLLRAEIRLYAKTDEEVASEIQDIWHFMAK